MIGLPPLDLKAGLQTPDLARPGFCRKRPRIVPSSHRIRQPLEMFGPGWDAAVHHGLPLTPGSGMTTMKTTANKSGATLSMRYTNAGMMLNAGPLTVDRSNSCPEPAIRTLPDVTARDEARRAKPTR